METIYLALTGVKANDANDLLQVIDSILGPLLPLGMGDIPLVEKPEKLKQMCEVVNKDLLTKHKNKVASILKGLSAKFVEKCFDNFDQDKVTFCQLIKNGEMEKASAVAKEYNKHGVEANKVRLSFLTAVHELIQKGTRASLPMLICYVRQMADKLTAVYPDKDGAKDFIKSAVNMMFKENLESLEKETGKAPDSCAMPEATANPSRLNSVLVAVVNAVISLQDK